MLAAKEKKKKTKFHNQNIKANFWDLEHSEGFDDY